MNKVNNSISIGLASLFLIASFTSIQARPIADRVERAQEVLINRQTALIPVSQWILEKSKCIGAIRVVKAGFMWGGQGSTGLVSCRTEENEWSMASFMQVSGVNWGFQIGIQFMESVMLFISDQARQLLNHFSFQVGSDIGVAVGPVGGGSDAGVMPKAGILTYDRSVGLYAGTTFNGSIISHMPRLNKEAHGCAIDGKDILKTNGSDSPDILKAFDKTLNLYFPTR